jgi:hypothetical protein
MKYEPGTYFGGAKMPFLSLLAVLLVAWTLVGCGGSSTPAASGGNGSKQGSSGSQTSPTTTVLLQMGDNPSSSDGQTIVFHLVVTSVTLMDSVSDTSTELLRDGAVELVHNASVTEPLAQVSVSPGTYDGVLIEYSGSTVTSLQADGTPLTQNLIPPSSQTIDLSQSPITIGTEPTILNINVDVAASLGGAQIAGRRPSSKYKALANGTMASPAVTVSQVAIPTSGQEEPETGEIDRFIGQVVAVNGNAMTISVGESPQTLTFMTSSDPLVTVFENVSLATALNATVEVAGSTQADGTLFASEVEGLESSTGADVEALLSGYNPSGTLYAVLRDGIGVGVTPDLVGQKITVDGTPSYDIHTGLLDLTGLPLTFDADHIFPGQAIEGDSASPLSLSDPDGNAGLITPFKIELEPQTISGTVLNYTAGSGNTATFDLALPTDGSSYLQVLNNGIAPVHIYQLSNTDLLNLSGPITNGQVVQVHGLLFCGDSNQGHQAGVNFSMAASRVSGTN